MKAVFICESCQTMTMIDPLDDSFVVEDGEPQPLGFCGIVRDTHTSPHDNCRGTIAFAGFVSLMNLRFEHASMQQELLRKLRA